MLPSAWHVLPLDTTAADIEALASQHHIESKSSRVLFRQSIITAMDQARLISAVFVAVLLSSEANPVAASMVAAEFPDEPVSAGSVELQWRAAGRPSERSSMAEGPMVISERRIPVQLGESDETLEMWEMQVAVPHLRTGGLLFAVSTPMVPIAAPLRTMSLAMISTLRWIEVEGSPDGDDPS
ncbi:MAG: hypothetical protein WCC60_24125 [Ilumatobacteraceae bacterium]